MASRRPSSASPTPRQVHVAQPTSRFAVPPPLVVDSSLVAAWLFGEAAGPAAKERMSGHSLHAPELLVYELANVARTACRRGADAAGVAAALAELPSLAISLHRAPHDALFDLAQRFNLTAYDAAYLWLAGTRRAPLATFDEKLAAAARLHLATTP